MASNPNRSRDLMENQPMKIWIENHGSVCLARPMDDAARLWVQATAPEGAQFFGNALAIEPRYVENFENVFVDAGGQLV